MADLRDLIKTGRPGMAEADADTEAARRLQSLAVEMQQFLEEQLDRLERVWAACEETLEKQAAIEQTYDELKQKQAQWEQQRQVELDHIEEEVELLTKAWDRLEAEQRRLLSSGQPTQPANAPQAAPLPAVTQTAPHRPDRDLVDVGSPQSGQTAAIQFQQLRREIRQHARRKH